MNDELKVGSEVRVYAVVSYSEPTGLRVESALLKVEGGPDGVPLCLSWYEPSRGGHVLGRYGSGSILVHEAALSEEEAVRRWRGEQLQSALSHEAQAREIRCKLAKPIKLADGSKTRPIPDLDEKR